MATLEQMASYSQTAQAAYAVNLDSNENNTDKYTDPSAGMSASQAAQFDTTWNVLQQSTFSLDGFSAVLLQNRATGEKVLAIRGTSLSDPADLLTDLVNIAIYGSVDAMPQYQSLENFYDQLVRDGQLSASEQIIVTGHSLGGFLAQAFTAQYNSVVSAAYTYNAPGFGGSSAELLTWLGVPNSTGSTKITNVHATDGISMTAGWGVLLGTSVDVRIEAATINQLANHSIIKLSDSLAVQSVFALLDPTVSVATTNSLLQSATNVSERSIESLLDSTLRLLVGDITTGTDNRESLYTNLQGLQNSLAVGGSLHALAGALYVSSASSALGSEAKTDFSALMALQTLSTVVLRGSNTANQALLDTTLGSVHADVYALWQADQGLSAEDRAAGKANFSDSWLTDRATMLNVLVKRNATDETGSLSVNLSGNVATTYLDNQSQQQVVTGDGNARKVVFGSNDDDSLNGGGGDDRLYGGGGGDGLWGGAGSDYLEGGEGVDALYGEAGDDTLIGGSGNDVLTTGSGRDALIGGAGFDVYNISKEANYATIRDVDGSGAIVIEKSDGSFYTLGSNTKELTVGSGYYEDDQHNRYQLSGGNLLIAIKDTGQTIVVEGFESMGGDRLGLSLLDGESPVVTPGSSTVLGDRQVDDLDPAMSGLQWNVDELGNAMGTPGAHAQGDILFGSEGSDLIVGGALGDQLYGDAGNDVMYADQIISIADALQVGVEDAGVLAYPLVEGGINDALAGGDGDDTLVGSAAADFLSGGKGLDLLIGGQGDDILVGDMDETVNTSRPRNTTLNDEVESLMPFATSSNSTRDIYIDDDYLRGSMGWTSTRTHNAGADDRLYGGGGNDWIIAGGGDDYVSGDGGDDTVYGGSGADSILGGAGDDHIYADRYYFETENPSNVDSSTDFSTSNDFVDGGEGNDYIMGGAADDVLVGGAGNDEVSGGSKDDSVDGGDGSDNLYGDGGNDTLLGGAGNDRLEGDELDNHSTAGDDYLDGGEGDDLLMGRDGSDTLLGQAGTDTAWGDGGSDRLLGGEGNDYLQGDSSGTAASDQGADYLDGGAGNDVLIGDGGADTLLGGEGDDQLDGDSSVTPQSVQGEDYLDGGAGNDVLWGQGGDDMLLGGVGNDQLVAGNGDDVLDGGDGNDQLWGGDGNDMLYAGSGTDYLAGDAGNDTYIFNGTDLQPVNGIIATVVDTQGNDTIVFTGGLALSEVDYIVTSGSSVQIGTAAGDRRLSITNSNITLQFSDGQTQTLAQLVGQRRQGVVNVITSTANATVLGGYDNDSITALGANATLSGGLGSDYLIGAASESTTYLYSRGDGADTIGDHSTQATDGSGPVNTLMLSGINLADLKIQDRDGQRFLLVNGTSDSLQVGSSSADAVGDRVLDRIQFTDGSIKTWAELVAALGVEVLGTNTGSPGIVTGTNANDRIIGGTDDETISAGGGDDQLDGGAGNDVMSGGAGSDTYLFGIGHGQDVINNSDTAVGKIDRLVIASSLTPSQVQFLRNDDSLVVQLLDGTDTLVVINYFNGAGLDQIVFENGAIYTPTNIQLTPFSSVPSLANDWIIGTAGNDTIDVLSGNDTVIAGDGNDAVIGGSGNDTLEGGAGNDWLDGGGGINQLTGGTGNDTYVVDNASDIVIELSNEGVDLVQSSITYTLGSDLENLTLTGATEINGTGNALGNVITGNDSRNYLTGGGGNDTLNGADGNDDLWSGNGSDFLYGGGGNDWMVADTESDEAGSGTDYLDGGSGNDVLWGEAGADTLLGGDGNDYLYGDGNGVSAAAQGDDYLDGGAGDDYLVGYRGNDTLIGGAGNDALYGSNGNDVLNGGDGNDQLYADGTGSDVLDGGAGNDTLYSVDSGDTVLFGRGDGKDSIDGRAIHFKGGVLPGDVKIDAAKGLDLTFSITGTADTIAIRDYFNVSGGAALAPIQLNFTDGSSRTINPISMTPTLDTYTASNVGQEIIVGNDLNNTIIGSSYDDLLNGRKGADTLTGGVGNDIYVVDIDGSFDTNVSYNSDDSRLRNFQDSVVEGVNEGIDTLIAFKVYSAILPDNVENMTVDSVANYSMSRWYNSNGFVDDTRRKFTGNALDNVIDSRLAGSVGTGAINDKYAGSGAGGEIVIDGGAGADTMLGADYLRTRFVVDNVGDVVIAGSGAFVTIDSYIDYALLTNFNNLSLSGTANINGTGNELNNNIDGSTNSAANVLIGGAGNDSYVVGAGDSIVELANEGIDTVRSSVAFSLSENVENLTLTGTGVGQNGVGNGLDNVIRGTTRSTNDGWAYYGNNTLSGGAGNDALWGEGQSDTLYGGDGDDALYGDSSSVAVALQGNDVLNGDAGNDLLYGFAGDDVLIGGSGNDLMDGSSGNDVYSIGAYSGVDIVSDSSGVDRIGISQLLSAANNAQLQFSRVGNDLKVGVDAQSSVTIQSWYTNPSQVIEKFSFSSEYGGLTYDYTSAQIQGRADGINTGPVAGVVYNQSGSTGQLFTYQVPVYTFFDIESQFSMAYSATLADGSVLPSWLVFDSASGTFTGTPPADSVGSLSILIIGTDAGGLSASTTFNLAIALGAITGTAGADVLTGDTSDNTISGLGGNDTLNGLEGNDSLYGGDGDDTYAGGAGNDNLDDWGNTGNDTLDGGDGDDQMYGGLGNDTYYGGTGNDYMDDWDQDGDDYMDGGTGVDEMWAGAGNDIYIVDNAGDIVGEELSQGVDEVRSSVTYTLTDNIENLTLTGSSALSGTGNFLDNVLTGNSGNNTLTGLAGNDRLDGGSAGTDSLRGGVGDDTYIVARSSGITITENANEGTDTVRASVTYTLGNNVENLILTGTSAINGTGNTLANIITGNSANNTLSGGAGTDTMIGGAGNDTYVVDNIGDVATEHANEGTDLVQSSVAYTVGSNIENLTLTGSSAINGTGNGLNNTLTGNSGANVLDGGVGADTMMGGAGNDIYVVDNTSDVVTEASSAGTDLVQSSVTYTLGSNVENLTLTGTALINGTGNTLANTLTGNSADNTLSGGTGADTMIGGAGDDTYLVDNTSDVVTEALSAGTDLVQSSVAYTLSTNVENLTLTGTSTINGTGNTLDNLLTGNSANNTLTGNAGNDVLDGGTGTDTLVGGAGNDVYYVDVSGDVTTESANSGIDTVNSAVTRTLAANIEALFLTGTTAINGTGNTLANLLRGNTVNNTLAGGGGTDILEGGAGNDILSNTSGNTVLNGGAGTDTLTGTANNDLLIGGTGNDALTTGQGADIIAFNKGDGQDTVAASTTKDNTLSIGGGTTYADLLFQKTGNDLILKVGGTDQITFTNYYASTSNRSVNTLQVILEGSSDYNAASSDALYNKKIESFNFDGLVSAFDAARTANPNLTTWALSGALVAQYLSGSDTAALGGDLAYQYGSFGNEANVSYTPAIGVLGSASFGTAAQTLQSLASLQDASPRLS